MTQRLRPLLLPVIVSLPIAAAVAAIYREVSEFSFVFDDGGFILANPPIREGLTVASLRWALTATYTGNWHPLTWLSHLIDVSLFGLQPGPPHVVNVLIHLANSLLVLALLHRLTGALWPGAFVAALFGVHPLHVESVAWVSERKDVLSGLFWLLTAAAYGRFVARRGAARYALVCLLFALGLMAKPMVVTLPAALLLLDWWPLGRLRPGEARRNWKPALLEKVPLFAMSAVAILVAVGAQRSSGALASVQVYEPLWRVGNATISYARYLLATLWPFGLAGYYPFPLAAPPLWQTAAAALLVLSVSGATLALARRNPSLLTGWAWYLVTVLPVLGLIQVGGQARADRYLYLPMIGLGFGAAWGARAFSGRLRFSGPALCGAALASLAVFGFVASLQTQHWRTNETLFTHALSVTTENWVAHSYLGAEAQKKGDKPAAMRHHREAVRINPSSSDLHFNLALTLAEAGLTAEAAGEFRLALHLNPSHAEARYQLARCLARLGQTPAALEHLRAAARQLPGRADVWNDLGDAAFQLGLWPEAEGAFGEALRLQPESPLFRWNLEQARSRGSREPR